MSQQRIIEKIAEQFIMEKYSVEKQLELSEAYPDFVLNIQKYYDYMVLEENQRSNNEFMNLEQNWTYQAEELKFTIIVGLIKLYDFLNLKKDQFTHGNIQPSNLVFNCGKVLLTNFGNESTDRKNFIRVLEQHQKQQLYPYLAKDLLRICYQKSFQELNKRSNESKQNADKDALAFIILEILFPQDFQNLKSQISIEKVLNERDKIVNNIRLITLQNFPYLAQNPNILQLIKNFLGGHFKYQELFNQNENDVKYQERDQLQNSQAFDQGSHLAPNATNNPDKNTKKEQDYFKLRPILNDCIDNQNDIGCEKTPTKFRVDLNTLIDNQFQQETNLLQAQIEQQEAQYENNLQQEQNQQAQLITQQPVHQIDQQIVQQIVQQEQQELVQQEAEYQRPDTSFTVQTSNENFIPLQAIPIEQNNNQSQQVLQNDRNIQQQESFSNQHQSIINFQEYDDQQQLLQENNNQQSQSQQLNLDKIDEPQSTNKYLKAFQERQSILKGTYQVGNFQNSENCRVIGDLIIKGSFQNNNISLNLENGNIIIFKELLENNTINQYIEVYEKVRTQRANYREPFSNQLDSIYKKYKILERENLVEFQLCFFYEGSIIKGIHNGHGKIQNYEKNFIYEGDWVGGKRYGYGTFKILNEQFYRQGCRWKYEGGFKNDKFHGKGKLYYKDDESIYEEGWFKNHKQVGLHKRIKYKNHCQSSNYLVLYINLCCNIGRVRIPFSCKFL